MKIGDLVLYKGQQYKVIYVYESGYLEIQKRFDVELIHCTEAEIITFAS